MLGMFVLNEYAFFMLNPNMAMKIQIWKILEKKIENFGQSSAVLDICI